MSRFFSGKTSGQIAAYNGCVDSLETSRIPPTDSAARICFVYRNPYSDTLRAALAAAETPARMRTKVAQVNEFAASTRQAVDPARNYGAMPLIVLTRGNMGLPPGSPPQPADEAAESAASDRAWIAGHDALAKLSTRGERRTVQGTGHMVRFDKPEAVTAAIEDVVKADSR